MEKEFQWSEEKNALLKQERNVCFEDVLVAFSLHNVLDILQHPNNDKYPNQKIFIIKILDYIYIVPFVENEDIIFLKTIIPSRKMTKQYLSI